MAHVAGGDRIFRIDAAHRATIALASDSLQWPNGITWDTSGKRSSSAHTPACRRFSPGGRHAAAGDHRLRAGRYDGVEILADRRLIVTSWADSTVTHSRGQRAHGHSRSSLAGRHRHRYATHAHRGAAAHQGSRGHHHDSCAEGRAVTRRAPRSRRSSLLGVLACARRPGAPRPPTR